LVIDRLEYSGNGAAGANGTGDRTAIQVDTRAAVQISRHGGKWNLQLFNICDLHVFLDEFFQPVALDRTHRGTDQRIVEQVILGQGECGPFKFKAVSFLRVKGANQASDTCTDYHIDWNLFLLERANHADVRESARCTATQHQRDFRPRLVSANVIDRRRRAATAECGDPQHEPDRADYPIERDHEFS